MRLLPEPVPRMKTRWLVRWLVAAGALALLGSYLSGIAQAAYPGSNGLIAFVRHGNIFTINPAHTSGSLVQLTRDGHDSGPRWSPSGNQVAYLDRGNLWVMNANGSSKTRITDSAPGYTDSRPSWSPNGQYLAFVKTQRGHKYGYLTRYSISTHAFRYFTTTVGGHRIRVAALPAPVAWAWALTAPKSTAHGSFIAYEGAASLCDFPHQYCLNLLGFGSQSEYMNGFPSAEYAPTSFRLTDPDWYPNDPLFDIDLMTTQENCPGGHCTPPGLDLEVTAAPVIPGAYQGVYSPTGTLIAYVRNVHGRAEIYVVVNGDSLAGPTRLVAGTEPDWQPRPATRVG